MKRILPKKKKKVVTPKRISDEPTPGFTRALHAYQQTVLPTFSNDDGLSEQQATSAATKTTPKSPLPMSSPISATPMSPIQEATSSPLSPGGNATSPISSPYPNSPMAMKVSTPRGQQLQQRPLATATPAAAAAASVNSVQHDLYDEEQQPYHTYAMMNDDHSNMADTHYEEQYGDAYVGAPMKYVYPNGYQSMRPRGGPWKLSIAICILFTWLSVFIVGHCSDRANSNGTATAAAMADIDDDYVASTLVFETRWCGSRLLYFMWVMSMLITGLAAAYCSVIGYIKVRDFAVANSRSQPPGMVGKSDYYVSLGDATTSNSGGGGGGGGGSSNYEKSIYQSDGTPQFWGGHIYRPTQAAVAVTSR